MKDRILGLEDFGLTPVTVARLGHRRITACVRLATYRLTPAVIRRAPDERLAYLTKRSEGWLARLRRRFPGVVFDTDEVGGRPHSVSARLPARDLILLAQQPSVSSVEVSGIAGYKKRPMRRIPLEWHCVRGLVAVQVEGATAGLQTVEDRFVLGRARSFDDANDRLRKEWREYAAPYLNSDGYLVRWQLERVVGVYALFDENIDPAGTEVFSDRKSRRMKPEYEWHPRGHRTAHMRGRS